MSLLVSNGLTVLCTLNAAIGTRPNVSRTHYQRTQMIPGKVAAVLAHVRAKQMWLEPRALMGGERVRTIARLDYRSIVRLAFVVSAHLSHSRPSRLLGAVLVEGGCG